MRIVTPLTSAGELIQHVQGLRNLGDVAARAGHRGVSRRFATRRESPLASIAALRAGKLANLLQGVVVTRCFLGNVSLAKVKNHDASVRAA